MLTYLTHEHITEMLSEAVAAEMPSSTRNLSEEMKVLGFYFRQKQTFKVSKRVTTYLSACICFSHIPRRWAFQDTR